MAARGAIPIIHHPSPDTRHSSLITRFSLSLGLGLLVVLALAVWGDVARVGEALGRFRWSYLPLILALTLGNYLLRFVKWHYYLGQIGARVPAGQSAAIFLSGLAMVMTPGKLGELLKSYLLRQVAGVPMSRSAPVVFAERLTDGIALLLLAGAGLALFRHGGPLLALLAGLSALLIAGVQHRRSATALLGLAEWLGHRVGLGEGWARGLRHFYDSAYRLLTAKNVLLAVGIGFISWLGECVAFYFVLSGLGLPPSWLLLVQAAFILAVSTLVGSASFLPGGLGLADASVTGLVLLLTSVERDVAVAATLLIRCCTLWFGVAVGALALLVFRGLLAAPGEPAMAGIPARGVPEGEGA